MPETQAAAPDPSPERFQLRNAAGAFGTVRRLARRRHRAKAFRIATPPGDEESLASDPTHLGLTSVANMPQEQDIAANNATSPLDYREQ